MGRREKLGPFQCLILILIIGGSTITMLNMGKGDDAKLRKATFKGLVESTSHYHENRGAPKE